ncbi:FadR/GntR family transcriptional regulator [Pandoraea anhela]|uniref:Transcriptional regulator n=1 Tax=Pandoraea anhela TaxID=2508295 RepID=A0A5E4Z5V3_9BURK|nr:FadR/GntR family transcriptional regulator [Pandoraea anhela]VVE56621.1 transcriptional regulator [Pandoraea anhela]
MSFDPIVQVSVSEQVAQRLLTMIRTGLLKPGQQLPPERDLATMLGVGRPAVREAIRGLALLGLLRIRQGEGTFVGSLEMRELLEPLEMVIELNAGTLGALFDARLVIEPGVAALAALHISDEDIARLHALVDDEQALLGNPETFAAADMVFHETIIDACENPFLQSIANSLYLLGKKSRGVTSQVDGVLERSLQDHRLILDALGAHDAERAAQAMRRHLCRVRDAYAASVAPD